MQKRSLTKSLVFAAILSQSPMALAGYDGPAVDYNFVMQKPSEYLICEQDRFNVSLDVYKACSKAQNAAEAFAERFGSQEGQIEGYLRGYSWGLHKTVKAYESNGDEMARGAANVLSLGEYFQIAIQAATTKGEADGAPRGAQDARGRFRAAVNSGNLPSRQFTVPAVTYRVEDNAYQTHVLQGKPMQNSTDILREDSSLGDIPIFGSMQGTTLRDREHQRPWHFWHSNTDAQGRMTNAGVYRFETRHWDDGKVAFQVWKDRSADNVQINYYENLVATAQRAPGTTNPDGTVTPGALLSDMYKEAFEKSYRYWANYYFSRSFHQQIDAGQLAGETLGIQVGKRVAYEKGLSQAFNRKFKESGVTEYKRAFGEAYTDSFGATYEDYANNPKLEVKFEDIVGQIADGIIQPGEKIGAQFKLTNFGGVGSNLQVYLEGDVQDSQMVTSYTIAGLTAQEYTTDFIATVDPRLQPRDTARVTLVINGELRDTLGQTVNNLVEIRGKDLDLDVLTGSGQIVVSAENLSTDATPGSVTAELTLNGKTIPASAGRLNPGQVKRIVLAFDGLDPLQLIKDEYVAEITLKHNGDVLDKFTQTLTSSKPIDEAVKYFDELANSKGTLPAFTSEKKQVEKTIAYLVKKNKDEVGRNSKRGGRNMYRKDPLTTIPGKMASAFESHDQKDLAKDRYDETARAMIKEAKRFKSFLWIAPKKRHYRKLVRKFAKNKKLK